MCVSVILIKLITESSTSSEYVKHCDVNSSVEVTHLRVQDIIIFQNKPFSFVILTIVVITTVVLSALTSEIKFYRLLL